MADIIKNDCQGERMLDDRIPINIELGKHGLYYGTSPAMKGLLVIGDSIEEVMRRVPHAISEMRAAEIASLQARLSEAREIIKSFHLEYVDYSVLNHLSAHNNHNPRWARRFLGMKEEMSLDDARAFLKEKDNG